MSIKITNPAKVARLFGEVPDDFKGEEQNLKFWVGVPGCEFYPSPEAKGRIINAPIVFSGGGAFIYHKTRRRRWTNYKPPADWERRANIGWSREMYSRMLETRSRGWKVGPMDFKLTHTVGPVRPLP